VTSVNGPAILTLDSELAMDQLQASIQQALDQDQEWIRNMQGFVMIPEPLHHKLEINSSFLCQVYIKRYPKFISKDIALSPK
jgi:hypothetical protein